MQIWRWVRRREKSVHGKEIAAGSLRQSLLLSRSSQPRGISPGSVSFKSMSSVSETTIHVSLSFSLYLHAPPFSLMLLSLYLYPLLPSLPLSSFYLMLFSLSSPPSFPISSLSLMLLSLSLSPPPPERSLCSSCQFAERGRTWPRRILCGRNCFQRDGETPAPNSTLHLITPNPGRHSTRFKIAAIEWECELILLSSSCRSLET